MRLLPAQASRCLSSLNTWDSEKHSVVTRMPTAKELQDQTQSYEGLVLMEGKPRRQSLIISAIRSGSVDMLLMVIKELGPCQNVMDVESFNTPLHYAAVASSSGDVLRALMANGHRPVVQNRYGWKPADYAKQLGNALASELLMYKADADRFGGDLGTDATEEDTARENLLVLTAVRSRQTDLIKFVIPRVHNAGLAFDPTNGNTALHYSVLVQDDPAVVVLLLQAGADMDKRCV